MRSILVVEDSCLAQDSISILQLGGRGFPALIQSPLQQVLNRRFAVPDGNCRQITQSSRREHQVLLIRDRQEHIPAELILDDYLKVCQSVSKRRDEIF